MRLAWIQAQTLEALGVRAPLAPLLRQGGEPTGARVLSGHADLKHWLGFLPRRHAAQGWQAKRDASRILGLAHPVLLGHPEKRFDRIGTDRQANLVETECLGGLELILE